MKKQNIGLFIAGCMMLLLLAPVGTKNPNISDTMQEWGSVNLEESIITLNKSDYINFTEPSVLAFGDDFRIFVSDLNFSHTWAKTAAENDWCNGSGTVSDPYIIEGLYINTHGGGGIYIYYSTAHFIIRNCWIDNDYPNLWDMGVLVFESKVGWGRIENNILTNFYNGITFVGNVVNSLISNNIMVNNISSNIDKGRAIHLDWKCNNVTVTENIIVNFHQGMHSGTSNNLTITENYMENNLIDTTYIIYPVYLRESNYSKIINNTLAGSFAYGSFGILNTGGIGNVIEYNEVIINSTDFLNTTLVISSNFDSQRLEIQAEPENVITLLNCNYNYIGYNVMLLPAEDPEPDDDDPDGTDDPEDPGDLVPDGGTETSIGGYDAILFISVASVAILTIVIRRRRR